MWVECLLKALEVWGSLDLKLVCGMWTVMEANGIGQMTESKMAIFGWWFRMKPQVCGKKIVSDCGNDFPGFGTCPLVMSCLLKSPE